MLVLAFIFAVSLLQGGNAFYLPGLASVTYCSDSKNNENCKSDIMVYVNRLNTVENIVPYEYHDFDFCVPIKDVANSPTENLGQVVFGERIRPSLYELAFARNEACKTVCEKTYKTGDKSSLEKLTFLKRGVSLNYQHHWIVDNMPITWCYKVETGDKFCSIGFPVGCYVTKLGKRKDTCVTLADFKASDTYYLYNHVDIVVEYHRLSPEDWGQQHTGIGGRIVAARLTPRSIDNGDKSEADACGASLPVLGIPGSLEKEIKFKYTYSVEWRVSYNF
uniref:Transmembrane 9 superfamily member n=1 Tax=Arion vulgaris TaxID=1028688 RepID=A0A0B7BEP0_9EUPU